METNKKVNYLLDIPKDWYPKRNQLLYESSKFFKGSAHLNNLLHEIIESIKYDLVILLKRALLENSQNQT